MFLFEHVTPDLKLCSEVGGVAPFEGKGISQLRFVVDCVYLVGDEHGELMFRLGGQVERPARCDRDRMGRVVLAWENGSMLQCPAASIQNEGGKGTGDGRWSSILDMLGRCRCLDWAFPFCSFGGTSLACPICLSCCCPLRHDLNGGWRFSVLTA